MASRGMGWRGETQSDLRPAQQVGLHRRVRVSHSSMASGWRVKASWREENRPSDSQRWAPPDLVGPSMAGGTVLPGLESLVVQFWHWGVLLYLGALHLALYTLLGLMGPPPE